MPVKPIDYSKTVIYKIEHNVDKSLVYVGSTTDFTIRKNRHKTNCGSKNKVHKYKLYVMIRENGGWESFQMLEIKKFPCNDSREARAEEERCRVDLKATMNARKAFWAETEQEYKKKWYQSNKEFFLEKQKEWYENNKEHVLAKQKERYEKNKEKIQKKEKEYRIATCLCSCNKIVTCANKARHLRSRNHKSTSNI
jgi:hypothetical protein